MEFVTGLLVFVVSWWLCFFTALPIGVQAQDEGDDGSEKDIVEGTVASAPKNPRILFKMGIATVGAAIITTLLLWLIDAP